MKPQKFKDLDFFASLVIKAGSIYQYRSLKLAKSFFVWYFLVPKWVFKNKILFARIDSPLIVADWWRLIKCGQIHEQQHILCTTFAGFIRQILEKTCFLSL